MQNDAFIGIDTEYLLADGRRTRRHYLDSAASTLTLRCARQVADQLLTHYANTHSQAHFSAHISSSAYQWAHQQVLSFFGLTGNNSYSACFAGSGSTALLNRIARSLNIQRPERDIVLVSLMEHHSNDLPHRKHARQVVSIPLLGNTTALGKIDLQALELLLHKYQQRVNYVAVTAASNITGIINPIHDIAALAHTHGAHIIVDAAQFAAHAPLAMSDNSSVERSLDAVVFSGHKIYAPGSPGVMLVRRSLLANQEPDELGGGVVDDVALSSYQISTQFPDREEAGTPNIPGAVQLGAVLNILQRIGVSTVHDTEQDLLQHLLDGLLAIPQAQIYGDLNLQDNPRLGVVAFNLAGIEHGLVAAVLNDYHNVAVRNGCFCAHPYVRELLKPELWALEIDPDASNAEALIEPWRGMVRASLGCYSRLEDIAALLNGVKDVLARVDYYRDQYQMDSAGNFHHKTFKPEAENSFNPEVILGASLHLG